MTICGVPIRVRGQDLKCELPPGHPEPHFAPHDQRCPSASIFLEDCALGLGHDSRHSDGTHQWGYPTDAAIPSKTPNTDTEAHIAATIAAPELVDEDTESDPFDVLHNAISFSSMDWGACKDTALIYGIICGWDDDNPLEGEDPHAALKELAHRFRWPTQKIESIRRLRAEWVRRTSSPIVPAPTEASAIRAAADALSSALVILDPLETGHWEHAWRTLNDLDDCAKREKDSAPAETEPWPTVDQVPDGVKFVAVNGPYPVVYVNRDGVRYLVGDGLPSEDDAEFINQFAPFIAAEAAQ
ncbi:hypothetical protein ACFVWF_32875 [Rhodococcus qingshengii]|uniref:hypothetical protein n=1 Tax=Rhodococcus qingshengii TaxID=334542 RepID=UPI0036D96C33